MLAETTNGCSMMSFITDSVSGWTLWSCENRVRICIFMDKKVGKSYEVPDAGHEVVVLVGGVAVHDAVKVGEVPEIGKK